MTAATVELLLICLVFLPHGSQKLKYYNAMMAQPPIAWKPCLSQSGFSGESFKLKCLSLKYFRGDAMLAESFDLEGSGA